MVKYEDFTKSLSEEAKNASESFYKMFFSSFEGSENIQCTSTCETDHEYVSELVWEN